jgi:hypothetical protein
MHSAKRVASPHLSVVLASPAESDFGDTRKRDGQNWTERSTSLLPDKRDRMGLAPLGNAVVVFGGTNRARVNVRVDGTVSAGP